MHILVSKLVAANSNYRLSKIALKIREKAKGSEIEIKRNY